MGTRLDGLAERVREHLSLAPEDARDVRGAVELVLRDIRELRRDMEDAVKPAFAEVNAILKAHYTRTGVTITVDPLGPAWRAIIDHLLES